MRIGVDLGGTKIEAIALDTTGRERLRRRVPTPREDYAGTLRAVVCPWHAWVTNLNTPFLREAVGTVTS